MCLISTTDTYICMVITRIEKKGKKAIWGNTKCQKDTRNPLSSCTLFFILQSAVLFTLRTGIFISYILNYYYILLLRNSLIDIGRGHAWMLLVDRLSDYYLRLGRNLICLLTIYLLLMVLVHLIFKI